MTFPPSFTQILLFTDTDGRARFREEQIPLTEGKPQARLSALMRSCSLMKNRFWFAPSLSADSRL